MPAIIKVLFFYCTISVCNELLCTLTKSGTNWYLGQTYTLVEYSSMVAIYYLISNNTAKRPWLYLAIVLYTVFFIVDCFFLGNINQVDASLVTVEAIIIIVLSVMFFFRLINNNYTGELTDYYLFWFNTAMMVYFSGSLAVFLFLRYILTYHPTDTTRGLWTVHLVFNIVYNILLAKSIHTWKKNRI